MTLVAGVTNYRYLMLHDKNGAELAGQGTGTFTLRALNEDGNIPGILSINEAWPAVHPGVYRVTINLGSYGTPKSWHFEVINSTTGFEFILEEASDTSAADGALARKCLTNRLELDPTAGTMKLYDDDNSLKLTHTVTDKTGAAISVATGVPARRSKGT